MKGKRDSTLHCHKKARKGCGLHLQPSKESAHHSTFSPHLFLYDSAQKRVRISRRSSGSCDNYTPANSCEDETNRSHTFFRRRMFLEQFATCILRRMPIGSRPAWSREYPLIRPRPYGTARYARDCILTNHSPLLRSPTLPP